MGHASKGQKGRISMAELSFYREMANVRAGVSSSVSQDAFRLRAETCQLETCLEKLLKTWNSSLRATRTNKALWDMQTL